MTLPLKLIGAVNPSDPPEEVTNEELENYSDKGKKTYSALSVKATMMNAGLRKRRNVNVKNYERLRKKLVEENQQLKTQSDKIITALIESAKKQVRI